MASVDRALGVAGMVATLIGTGLIWLYPEKKWIGLVFVSLGVVALLIYVIHLIVTSNKKERPQSQQLPEGGIHIYNNPNISPTFSPQFNQQLSQSHPQIITADNNSIDKEKRLEIARTLSEELEVGRKIMRDCARHTNAPTANAVAWEIDMKAYIEENLGESAGLDFGRAYPTIPYPDLANNRELVDRLHTKLQRLGTLISEILK
jgi:hypothetical protein